MILALVHQLSPIIIQFGEGFALRWYGLAYVVGFYLGYLLLRTLSRRQLWCLPEEKIGDFIMGVAVFGVLLGGRLGYIIFYYLRDNGWAYFQQDPLVIFRVWEGGMASHGGLAGVIIFTYIYARKQKMPTLGLLDGLAMAAPIGLCLGRIANFINGELYGRMTEGVAWAMKFPMEMWNRPVLAYDAYQLLAQSGNKDIVMSPEGLSSADIERLIELNRSNPEVRNALEQCLSARHPSQLYEALAEGVIIFIVLLWVRMRYPRLGDGFIAGLFSLLYGIGRIVVECYREPDAALVGGMTMGQFLSVFLIVLGVVLVGISWCKSRVINS